MKTLVSVLAVAVALAFTGPAFAAGDVTKAKTAAECAKAGGICRHQHMHSEKDVSS